MVGRDEDQDGTTPVEILPPARAPLASEQVGRTFDAAGHVEDWGRPERPPANEPPPTRGCLWLLRRLSLGVAILAAAAIALGVGLSGEAMDAGGVVAWMRNQGVTAMAGVVVFVAAVTPLFVPAGLLAILPGYVWGTVTGTTLVLVGAALGGCLNMLLARSWMRGRVGRWVERQPMLAALRAAIQQRGFRIALLLRMSPVAPYSVLAYFAGAAGLSLPRFVLASIVGGIPWTTVYAAFGAVLAASQRPVALEAPPDDGTTVLLRWLGLAFTIAVAVWIGRLARAELQGLQGRVGPR